LKTISWKVDFLVSKWPNLARGQFIHGLNNDSIFEYYQMVRLNLKDILIMVMERNTTTTISINERGIC
jgi:hypothetical protein